MFNKEMLGSQYFYNIFTINHEWLVIVGSNLNLTLKLLFSPTITTYHSEFVIKIL